MVCWSMEQAIIVPNSHLPIMMVITMFHITAMFDLMIESIVRMDWWICFILLNENRNHDVVHRELEPNVLPCGLQDLRVLLQAL